MGGHIDMVKLLIHPTLITMSLTMTAGRCIKVNIDMCCLTKPWEETSGCLFYQSYTTLSGSSRIAKLGTCIP